jgi:hypothetical protein
MVLRWRTHFFDREVTMTFGRVCLIVVLCFGLVLLPSGCNKTQAPAPAAQQQAAPPPPPPPPTPPDTSYGRLTKVERLNRAPVEAMTLSGIRKSEAKASKGQIFLTLSFEGKRCGAGGGMVAMQSVGADGVMARTDEKSWITNEQGKKFSPGVPSAGKDSCIIAFEVPTDATGLRWHDGRKATYRLEPTIVAEASPPGLEKPEGQKK